MAAISWPERTDHQAPANNVGSRTRIVSTVRNEPGAGDPSNGYEAVAPEFMWRREESNIAVAMV